MENYDAIIKARDAIRKKCNKLRRGETETAVELEKTFAPLTRPLKEIAGRLSRRDETSGGVESEVNLTPDRSFPIVTGDDGDVTRYVDSNFGPEVAPYIRDMIIFGKDFDHTYGVRQSGRGRWTIGKEEVTFGKDDSVTVAGETFQSTPGLLELIFKKSPLSYTNEDTDKYKRILDLTNAHRRNNQEDGPLIANRTSKYRDVVRVLFPTKKKGEKQGSGLKFIPDAGRSYVYWDNPEELVDRLQLLRGSREAGHTGHAREILSIEEELREAGYIW